MGHSEVFGREVEIRIANRAEKLRAGEKIAAVDERGWHAEAPVGASYAVATRHPKFLKAKMTYSNHRIGILGGAGPLASAEFHKRLIELAATEWGAFQDSEYPEVVHVSHGYPGLTEAGLVNMAAARDTVTHSVEFLKNAGCRHVAVPCNSLHAFIPELREQFGELVLDMIDATAGYVAKSAPDRPVLVLGSGSTREGGLYDGALAARGLSRLAPDESTQSRTNALIAGVMLHGASEGLDAALSELIREVAAPTTSVILGCTELSLIRPRGVPNPVFDSTTALAHATLGALAG
ncbi:MAG: aspartate/glutamate racemase family protein [Verrucomicrobium sp.]|nr:aspartate/glutamate racemase family protein [Verrucomicrobium sp.]